MTDSDSWETLKRRRRWAVWILAALGLLIGLPVLLFFGAGWWVDTTHIPPELEAPPAELANLPAADATFAGEATAGMGFPVARRAHGDGDPRGHDYKAFLQAELRDRPELEGARLYLDLADRFSKRSGDSTQYLRGLSYSEWRKHRETDGRMNSYLEKELLANADLVEEMLRFGESSGLPVRSPQAIAESSDSAFITSPKVDTAQLWAEILTAEAERRTYAGDFAGAARCTLAAIRIAVNLAVEPYNCDEAYGTRPFESQTRLLSIWVRSADAPPEVLTVLQKLLAQAHRDLFRAGASNPQMSKGDLATHRYLFTVLTSSSWRSPEFGWDLGTGSWIDNAHYSLSVCGIKLPRLGRLAATTSLAMQNKLELPQTLRNYEQAEVEAASRDRMNWPQRMAAGPLALPEDSMPRSTYYGLKRRDDEQEKALAHRLLAEARLNLLRSAIEWRLAPGDAKPGPATMTVADRESPWRDPFAEAPLRATALPDDGGMLLYSLGPDLKDQQGQIEYDPTNGTVSAGDPTLEVKR